MLRGGYTIVCFYEVNLFVRDNKKGNICFCVNKSKIYKDELNIVYFRLIAKVPGFHSHLYLN